MSKIFVKKRQQHSHKEASEMPYDTARIISIQLSIHKQTNKKVRSKRLLPSIRLILYQCVRSAVPSIRILSTIICFWILDANDLPFEFYFVLDKTKSFTGTNRAIENNIEEKYVCNANLCTKLA